MKIIDDKCIGCGTCSLNYPKNFKIVNNKAKVIKDSKDKQILKTCPTDAIVK